MTSRLGAPFLSTALLILAGCGGSSPGPGDADQEVLLEFRLNGTARGQTSHELEIAVPHKGFEFVQGVRGQAIRFDGTGAQIVVRGVGELPIGDQMTLEFWLKPEGHNPVRRSSSYICASHSSVFYVGFNAHSNRVTGRLTTDAGIVKLTGERDSIELGAWHHVALVYYGTEVILYVDGEVTARESIGGMIALQPKLSFGIGTWHQTNQAYYGSLDELRLLNWALSPDDIAVRIERASYALISSPVSSSRTRKASTIVSSPSRRQISMPSSGTVTNRLFGHQR